MFSKLKKIIILFTASICLSVKASNSSEDDFDKIIRSEYPIVYGAVKFSDIMKKLPAKIYNNVYNYAIDYPLRAGVAVGSIVAVACLVSSELRTQKDDVKELARDKSLLRLPFNHGLKPYYLGGIAGAAAVVTTRKAKLGSEVSRALKSSSKVCSSAQQVCDTALNQETRLAIISRESQKNKGLMENLSLQSDKALDGSKRVLFGLRATREGIEEAVRQVENIDELLVQTGSQVKHVSQDIKEGVQVLKKLSNQTGRVDMATKAASLAQIYELDGLEKRQVDSNISACGMCVTVDRLLKQQFGQNSAVESSMETVSSIERKIDQASESTNRSLSLVKEINKTSLSAFAVAGSDE